MHGNSFFVCSPAALGSAASTSDKTRAQHRPTLQPHHEPPQWHETLEDYERRGVNRVETKEPMTRFHLKTSTPMQIDKTPLHTPNLTFLGSPRMGYEPPADGRCGPLVTNVPSRHSEPTLPITTTKPRDTCGRQRNTTQMRPTATKIQSTRLA